MQMNDERMKQEEQLSRSSHFAVTAHTKESANYKEMISPRCKGTR